MSDPNRSDAPPRSQSGQFLPGHTYSRPTQFQKGQHWRPRKPHWEADWLRHQYVTLGRSAQDIANECGITNTAIYHWMDRHGIPRRNTSQARGVKHWGLEGPSNPMYGKRGPLNKNWKGGYTPLRQKLYSRSEWRSLARRVRRRDKVCQLCGANHKLELHHIHRFCDAPLLFMDEQNVLMLCELCHRKLRGREKWWRKRLLAIVAAKYPKE